MDIVDWRDMQFMTDWIKKLEKMITNKSYKYAFLLLVLYDYDKKGKIIFDNIFEDNFDSFYSKINYDQTNGVCQALYYMNKSDSFIEIKFNSVSKKTGPLSKKVYKEVIEEIKLKAEFEEFISQKGEVQSKFKRVLREKFIQKLLDDGVVIEKTELINLIEDHFYRKRYYLQILGKRSKDNLNKMLDTKIWAHKNENDFKNLILGDVLILVHHFSSEVGLNPRGAKVNDFVDCNNGCEYKKYFLLRIISEPLIKKEPLYGDDFPLEYNIEVLEERENLKICKLDKETLENLRYLNTQPQRLKQVYRYEFQKFNFMNNFMIDMNDKKPLKNKVWMVNQSVDNINKSYIFAPIVNKGGSKAYENMTRVKRGDFIIHNQTKRSSGQSGEGGFKYVSKTKSDLINLRDVYDESIGIVDGRKIDIETIHSFNPSFDWEKIPISIRNGSDAFNNSKDGRPKQSGYIHMIGEELLKYLINQIPELMHIFGKLLIEGGDIMNDEMEFLEKDNLEDVFIDEDVFNNYCDTLEYKKNIILEGAPGVGKTFIAKKIAYHMMKAYNDKNIEMIQFHQSYSYEDFIQGYVPNDDGSFKIKNKIFYNFVRKAKEDKDGLYFFIIDEINRGNLSKIFGELLMLIENDKRGPNFSLSLTYDEEGEKFYIPPNLYLIGTMNTADRSIAIVDYALRRRFAFIKLYPKFGNDKFKKYLIKNHIDESIVNKISDIMEKVNMDIEENSELGDGYLIGHSYFCNISNKIKSRHDIDIINKWLKTIVDYELIPILNEYYFGDELKIKDLQDDFKGLYTHKGK